MRLPSVIGDIFRYSVGCCCLLTLFVLFTSGGQIYFLLREYFLAYIFISPYLPQEVGRIYSIVEASRSHFITGVAADSNFTDLSADSSAYTYLQGLTAQPLVTMPPAAPDTIELLNAPSSVTVGDTIYLSVKYNVTSYRLLICDLLSKDDYKQYATGKIHIDKAPVEQSQYMAANSERGHHAVIPLHFHLNAAPAAGTRYILQLWSVDPDIYDKDPSVAWHHWTAHTAYDVAVTSDRSLLPHILQQRASNHQSIGVDCVSVTHLVKTFNTSGTSVVVATYRKTNHQQSMHIIADLLDATDNRFTNHGSGIVTIGASNVVDKDEDIVGEASVTVYVSGTSPITPNAQYVLSVWLVDANTYDTIMKKGGDDAANLWRHAVDHHVYPVTVAEGGYAPGKDWQLIWNDEFDGSAVDQSNWSFEYGNGEGGWGNNELQDYTDTNVYLENSQLVIVARKEGARYTSARLKTQGKRNFTHGKIAGRLKAPRGKGFWPAFWMLGESISEVSWPRCGELDIMELVGENSPDNAEDCTVYFNTHWQSNDNHQHLHYGTKMHLPKSKYNSNWHIFECEWNAQYVIGRMDGVEYYRMNIAARDDTQQLQRGDPMFILLNLAIGGWWPGSPADDTPFPQEYRIDWIRAYKHEPHNSVASTNTMRQLQQLSIDPSQPASPATTATATTPTAAAASAMPPPHPQSAAGHRKAASSAASSPERPSALRQGSPSQSPIKPDYKPQSSLGRTASFVDGKSPRHSRVYSRSATADEEEAMYRDVAAQAAEQQHLPESERVAIERRKAQLFALYPAMTELDYWRFEKAVSSDTTAKQLWQRQLTDLDSQVLQTLMIRSKEYNGTNWQKMKSFLGLR